jgi:protein gp37
MGKTAIEWTNRTWNPLAGCQIVSEACRNCYAMNEAYRLDVKLGQEKYRGLAKLTSAGQKLWTGQIRFWPKALADVTPGQAPAMIFVNSMSDPYHADVEVDWLKRIFERMNLCSQHTFQILTKRPERMLEVAHLVEWTPNIWQGVTIESEPHAGRADLLRVHPAAVRFISAEPLMGDLAQALDLFGIDWLIAGGESGGDLGQIRRMSPQWARNLRDLCRREEVAFFFKQWGNWGEDGEWRGRFPKSETLDGVLHHNFPPIRSAPCRPIA